MDATDRKILDIIEADSWLTSEALGARIGLSPSATHRRVKLLEESGLIQGYRARLSSEAQGNPSTVFVSVTLIDQRQSTLAAFEEALLNTKVVKEAHLMSGESDYLLKVLVRDSDSYERVHREILSALPGVHRLVTQFTIRTVISGA
ncbi:MAG TPA: Lrp/AsnC family transcriptional regulator [Allosphingosinicella sp.]|uniref:Lrp/AsnC family transcriptional regulator n=1 Tax=Allosphingosinicella sp. TaxID=2823234 RepID=UPI002ED85CB8